MNLRIAILFAAAWLASGPLQAAAPVATFRVIGFLTDFGVQDDAVGICRAVMDGVAPGVRVLDIAHQVEPRNVAQGARFLAEAAPYLPSDAVLVVVVDSGAGAAHRAIVARSKRGQTFVLPDNGLLTLVQDGEGLVGAREIRNDKWMIGARRASTFHGRDIFAPVAAHLARGADWTLAGPALDVAALVRLDIARATLDDMGASTEVVGADGPYGNLVLNLDAAMFAKLGYQPGELVPVAFDGERHEFTFVSTFDAVPPGKELLYLDARGRVSIAIRQGNFAEVYKVGAGTKVFIPRQSTLGR